MVPQASCSPARQCWLRAWERARAEKLIPFRNADGTWSVKTYTVSIVGAGWSALSCTCAGNRHVACKHRAVVAKAIAAGIRPIRGTEKGKEVASAIPSPTATTSTASAIPVGTTGARAAYAAQIAAERAAAHAQYTAAIAVGAARSRALVAAGVDPLMECFA